ncbi:hypothetical protein DC429_00420 [Arthrobacter sp. TPD3018]|uniref:hypothetical protein n=1 Tax=Bacteria TaxID=2 RepID=UPI000D50FC71|nr:MULTISPECIES: hypothetical protein [Bacteria]PVE58919.1 hypothetical protein DC425_00420 [Sphingomonas sp. TPD3009]PVE60442.1 hypothetical protein DC429_00420 [Arthrobacter sp. TPD3018]PVE87119.1 hypothetical protein DC431_00415 [Sphingomonas melonis]
MTGGRPLRFLAIVLGGWIGMRTLALLQAGDLPLAPLANPVEHIVAALGIGTAEAAPRPPLPMTGATPTPRPNHTPIASPLTLSRIPAAAARTEGDRPAPATTTTPRPTPPPLLPLATPVTITPRGPSRLSGSIWGITRGGGIGQASGGQLGGSQAGIRVTYALGTSRRVALAARLSTPLAGRGAEAAVGLDWQPTRLPIHLLAERRIALDGGRGGTMLGLVGGYGPAPIAGAVTVEGYGQAGLIARDGTEAFVDGALRLAHPVMRRGKARLDVGVGAWGGAQRGAARLDIGPSLGLVVPVANHSLRLTADWRQRIAGDARPDSGPALSIGTNF